MRGTYPVLRVFGRSLVLSAHEKEGRRFCCSVAEERRIRKNRSTSIKNRTDNTNHLDGVELTGEVVEGD